LARLAAAAVRATLGTRPVDGRAPTAAALRRLGASFVTLERDEALRGCIGTLEPVRPLYRDVTRNALRATVDPRLPRVTAREWPHLRVSVSVLSRSEPLPAASLEELLARLRPMVDGLTLAAGERRSTFLPAVWRKLPRPEDFVAALLRKGGWPADRLPAGVRIRRYTTAEFADVAPHEPLSRR
jgi:AmmeMemoRadiSam system protein A